MQTDGVTKGQSLISAHLTIVLAGGLIGSIGWARSESLDLATLDEVHPTTERPLRGLAGPSLSPGRLFPTTLWHRFLSTRTQSGLVGSALTRPPFLARSSQELMFWGACWAGLPSARRAAVQHTALVTARMTGYGPRSFS